jgi:ceramide glucosyltransferase
VGKSMLIRKEDLINIGGLEAFKDVLAEDHLIGRKIEENGKKVIVSNHMVDNMNEYWGMERFMNRHLRWAKMRWKIGGMKYVSELVTNPVFMSSLLVLFKGPSEGPLAILLSVCFIKAMGDLYLGHRIGAKLHPLVYLLSPVKDILVGCIWFGPLWSETVVWRGNRYLIGRNTVLSPCSEKDIWAWIYRMSRAIKTKLATFP